MLKGFKDFLMRGNVVELAVAVVVGTAFTAIITSITRNLIQPILAAIGGSGVNGLAWQIVDGNDKSIVNFAAVITSMIDFFIIAAVVYFGLVLPLKIIQERRRRGEETGPSEPTDVEVLLEIRDLMRQQSQQSMPQGASPFPGGQPGQYPPGPGGLGPAGPPPQGPGGPPLGPGPGGPPHSGPAGPPTRRPPGTR